jgi:hypothetical protein
VKKAGFSLIFFGLILALLSAYTTAISDKSSKIQDIAVTLINQEPDPANPGGYVDVRFKFDNNGSGSANNVEVEILLEYPFSLLPDDNAVRNIGTLQSRQKGDVGVIVKYRLLVDKNAVEGKNELKVRYRVNKEAWIEPEEFFIDIRTSDAILSVDSISVDTKTLIPGKPSLVTIKVSNKADSIIRDVQADLGISSVPIVPIGSSNQKSTYQINSRSSYDFKFTLLAEPEALSGVYKVPLKLEFEDVTGREYTKNGTIGLIIGATPDMSVTIDDSTIFEPGKAGDIIIKVVNKGVTDLKFVNLRLMESEKFKIISNSQVYLGNIDSDDFETAAFNIFVEKNKDAKVILPFQLEFKDANNNDFSENVNLDLSLYSGSEAKRYGLKKRNGFIGILIIVAIVLAGLFFYRKYRKKKKKT